jgi:HSP20 family protein
MYQTKSYYNVNPRSISNMLENIFQNGLGQVMGDNLETNTPPVNIFENEKAYEVHVVAPGLKKEDFKLNVEKDVLSVSFEKKEEAKDEAGKWLRSEYKFRSFKRSFTLNDKINTAGINAKYNDGILVVSLPKKENAEPATHEIPVN